MTHQPHPTQPTKPHWQHILIAILSVVVVLGVGFIALPEVSSKEVISMAEPIPILPTIAIFAVISGTLLGIWIWFKPDKEQPDLESPEPIEINYYEFEEKQPRLIKDLFKKYWLSDELKEDIIKIDNSARADEREKIIDLFGKFKNPIREDSSIIGDFIDIRLFKEDWEKLKQKLKEGE